MASSGLDGISCPQTGCGHFNKSSAEFCAQCGASLAPATAKTNAIPPLPENATPEQKEEHWYKYVYQGDHVPQLTLRAVVMGGFLGAIMSIANLYTTLKIGWAFGVAITACVLSYVIWNTLRAFTGGRLSQMSILENNCMQSTASAAGYSTGSTIGTAFGALLLLTGAHVPWTVLATFTFFTAMLGVFLAIPLKRQMVNIEQLKFPSGIAAAETLRSLYSHGSEAMRKAYSLIAALFVGVLVAILRFPEGGLHFLDRILGKFRLPEAIPFERGDPTAAMPHRGGFFFEPSGLLIAAGMIVGNRVCLSMLAGSCLLYLYIGPMLAAIDAQHAAESNYVRSIPLNPSGTMLRLTLWSLWGGSATMVFASLASVAIQWKTIARSFKSLTGSRSKGTEGNYSSVEVPAKWLIGGMIPIGIGMVIVQYLAFGISIWLGAIAVAMSFLVSLVCCRATGETDTTPIGAMGKVTQLLYAFLAPGNGTTNLMAASVTANSGSSSADLLTDLKSGYLLGANPRKQFWAQFSGVFFGTVAIVPAWYLMVPDKAALEAFNPPSTTLWYAVAVALTQGLHNLPLSAKYAILIGALVGTMLTVVSELFPKARPYLPSAMGLGLSWVMPFANSLSFAIGSMLAWLWSVVARKSADVYTIPIASGLVAGESTMSGLLSIVVTLKKIAGW